VAETIVVLVGDIGLGRVQRKVLTWSIHAMAGQPLTLRWATDLPLMVPLVWPVKPEVGLPLLAKLWLLHQSLTGPAIYLDGNLILQSDLTELLPELTPGSLLVPQRLPLKALKIFAVSPMVQGQQQPSLPLHWQQQKYGEVANFSGYSHRLCQSTWQPVPYGQNANARVIDCSPLPHRPWYRPWAPGHELWLAQVAQALQAGVLTWEDINTDLDDQKLHPAWLNQLNFMGRDQAVAKPNLTATATFIPPELQVSQAQQQQLGENPYPLPQKSRVKVLLSSYLWQITLPTRLNRLLGKADAKP
jgi:hypothetical protein